MIPKHASMRALAVLLALAAGLCFAPAGAGAEAEGGAEARINALLGQMTLEEKICQLFFVRPEDFSRISSVTKGSAKLENAPVALQRFTQKHPLQARYGQWLQGR